MELMKEADFRRELKNAPGAGYLFFGEEDYLKAYDLKLAVRTVCPDPSLALFNAVDFDALSYSPSALEDALMAPPMLADRKLVTVRGLDISSMRADEVDALAEVCARAEEYENSLLIVSVPDRMIDPGYLPKRPSAVLEKLAKGLKPVYFPRSTPQQLTAWTAKHYAAAGVEADAAVCSATVSRCGTDMFRLASEIEKIAMYTLAHGRKTVSAEDVEMVGIPSEEFDGFAFSNALLEGRQADALRILRDMKLRRVEPISALGEVIRVWCDLASVKALMNNGVPPAGIAQVLKMHSYKAGLYVRQAAQLSDETLHRAISACMDADASMKSGSGQGYRPLELLICSLSY